MTDARTPPDTTSARRILQRIVLPPPSGPDVLPLYVTGSDDGPARADVLDRRRLRIPAGRTASFATYFNALPASYWQRWSTLDAVDLVVRLSGPGTVTAWVSDAAGNAAVAHREQSSGGRVCLRLPLDRFAEGGWAWFDVTAGTGDVIVEAADWTAGAPVEAPQGSVTIAVTTLNRAAYVVSLLASLGEDPAVLAAVDEILVVDQGDKRVRAEPGFAEVEARLGGRLRVLEQPNLGGSGGFARGMAEALAARRSRYVLLMDDDVAVEPESVLRSIAFAGLARGPLLVGGHMFSLDERTRLHSFGEVVRPERYEWGPADGVESGHDFATRGLAASPWMHRRFDVDYTAWWLCLIPVEAIEAIGLSAPFFIAWDDAEYGIRAAAAGYPTVTLPGVAIWHMPFTTKVDLADWKIYFEDRNRLITALLHRPAGGARGILDASLRQILRHLMSMQYAAAELRIAALEDLLAGPARLHATLPTRLAEIRALRGRYPDAAIATDLQGFPAVTDRVVGRSAALPSAPGVAGKIRAALGGLLRQARPTASAPDGQPQALVPNGDAAWWRLALLDSALVWSRDDAGVRHYRRDRAAFARLLRRALAVHGRLLVRWEALRAVYRADWHEQTSPAAWLRSLATAGVTVGGQADLNPLPDAGARTPAPAEARPVRAPASLSD
jgi:galactofuranosylgalactofuranosylrhamnosyl-N-acetylglucosaminyl-diphospho-decaprenol beta-1,5/1,6-galactofuranosyltransferase